MPPEPPAARPRPLEPDYAESRLALARLELAAGRRDAAARALREALEGNPLLRSAIEADPALRTLL